MIRPLRAVPVGLTVWIQTLILWLTWSPFIPREGKIDFSLLPADVLVEPLVNLLLLVPLGLLLGFTLVAESKRSARNLALIVLAVSVFVVEGGQLAVEGRTVSLSDGLLNLFGGYLGWVGARRLALPPGKRGLAVAWLGSFLTAAVLGYMVGTAGRANGVHRLEGWRSDFQVVVGHEVGGNRGYRGALRDAQICSGSSTEEFCLTEQRADSVARRRLVRTAVATQRVSLAAVVRSRTDEQRGPARIITFSEDISRRNAMLGQEGRALILRLRTPVAGENGTGVAFRLPDAIRSGEWTSVGARYVEGLVRLRAEGEDGVVRSKGFDTTIWSWANLVLDDLDSRRPFQLWLAVVLGLVASFLPFGLAGGWLLSTSARTGLFLAFVPSICLMLTFTYLLRFAAGFAWQAAACAAAALGLFLGYWDRRRARE